MKNLLIVFLLFLSGCAPNYSWYQYKNGESNGNVAHAQCKAEATYTRSRQDCSEVCSGTGLGSGLACGQCYAHNINPVAVSDSIFLQCMSKSGWSICREGEMGSYPPCSEVTVYSNESDSINKVATAKPPQGANVAENVFENTWRSVVVIKNNERQGSGVIIRPNIVATNCHVIDGGGDIVVYKHDNRRASTDTLFKAIIRERNDDKDFCLLDVSSLWGIPATVRKYDTLKIGEDVYALGSPKGLDLSLSAGIVSQLRQGSERRWIQTDAAFSPGSSGGGLFDSNGNLIGILTSKVVKDDAEGIGFAIPADLALDL